LIVYFVESEEHKMKISDWRDNLLNDIKDPRLMIPRPYPMVGWALNFGQRST
jgi:hypothetical protein